MNDPCIIPTKIIWKRTVKNAIIYKEDVLWRERLHSENDFEYFVRLHTDIKPALVYTLSNERSYLFTASLIAKIWARSVKIESKNCVYCGSIYEDYLAHIISTCLISSDIRDSFYNDIRFLTSRYLVDKMRQLSERENVLKILGADIEPRIDEGLQVYFSKRCFKYVVDCHKYFDKLT